MVKNTFHDLIYIHDSLHACESYLGWSFLSKCCKNMPAMPRVGGHSASHCGRLTSFVCLRAAASAPAPVLRGDWYCFGIFMRQGRESWLPNVLERTKCFMDVSLGLMSRGPDGCVPRQFLAELLPTPRATISPPSPLQFSPKRKWLLFMQKQSEESVIGHFNHLFADNVFSSETWASSILDGYYYESNAPRQKHFF